MVRAGTYGRPGARRQLWWCRPSGEPAHRFSERLPRALLDGEGHSCPSCETTVASFEGPQHPRQYEYAARLVAETLVRVGSGTSYRHASRAARAAVGPAVRKWAARSVKFGANGQLAGDWVAAFSPVVTGPVFEAESWPRVVALDEFGFLSTVSQGRRRAKSQAMWTVWGAYAAQGHGPGQLFRLGVSGKLNATAAADWLRSIPGRPEYVVCDGTKLWPKAVALAWPQVVDEVTGEVLEETPKLMPCEYHLRQKMEEQLRASRLLPPRDAGQWRAPRQPQTVGRTHLRVAAQQPDDATQTVRLRDYTDPDQHPLVIACRRAFWDVEKWDETYQLALKWQALPLATWMVKHRWMREVLATRPLEVPRSIGGLEAQLTRVRTLLRDRSRLFRNQVRTQRLLDLMTLHLRTEDQVDDYATRIREHLDANHGTGPKQRAGVAGQFFR